MLTGDAMKSELSAFLDDELESSRQPTLLAAIVSDEELRRTWDGYHLIGDALRRSGGLDQQLAARVMASLHHDPVVLAPQLRRTSHLLRSSLAVAATVAGVALVAWVAIAPQQAGIGMLAKADVSIGAQAPNPARAHLALASADTSDGSLLQEYMIAHQAYSPGNRIQGGTAYVRSVSMIEDAAAR